MKLGLRETTLFVEEFRLGGGGSGGAGGAAGDADDA